MAKYIIVVPPFLGHINPTLSIGIELLARGHAVKWLCAIAIDKKYFPREIDFICPDEALNNRHDIQARLQHARIAGHRSQAEIFKVHLQDTLIPISQMLAPGLEQLIAKFEPDVIINDGYAFVGGIIAYKFDIPYVSSWVEYPDTLEHHRGSRVYAWQCEQLMNLQKSLGVDASKLVCASEQYNFSYTSDFFAPQDLSRPYEYVGPVVKHRSLSIEFSWEKIYQTDLPKVLISVGTLADASGSFYEKVVAAFAGLSIQFIVSAKPDLLDQWPENFLVSPYVPQVDLLPHLSAVIYHGGFNTTCESLLYGLPLLVMPLSLDQFNVSQLVTEHGCGLSIKFRRLTPKILRDALQEIIVNPQYRHAAEAIQTTLIHAGGTERAADILIEFAKQQQAVG